MLQDNSIRPLSCFKESSNVALLLVAGAFHLPLSHFLVQGPLPSRFDSVILLSSSGANYTSDLALVFSVKQQVLLFLSEGVKGYRFSGPDRF